MLGLGLSLAIVLKTTVSQTALLTAADFQNAAWTASTNVQRFQGPWLFAPIQPGITVNVPAISNSNQQPVYSTLDDVYIRGDTHFSPINTQITGSIQISGGRKVVLRGIDINSTGSATGGKFQALKMAQSAIVEGIFGDFASNPTDQDGLVVGGCAAARLTASIASSYMSVTARTFVTGSASVGDLIIGGTLTSGTGVTVGTKIADFGNCNAIGSISGTTLTTTQETGAPIVPGTSSDGMTVEIDGGVVVGRVTAGSAGTYTITNAAGLTVPAGSRIFIYSTGGIGSYLLDTPQTVSSTSIDFYPPTGGYYGVPADVPTDRIAEVAANYGPLIFRQTCRILNTHGTNLCKTIAATNAAAALNSAPLTSANMTGAQTCRVVLAGTIAGLNPRGAWATATAYAQGDAVTQGGVVYFCAQAHTSGTFATDLTTNTYWVDPTAIGGGNQNAATFKLAKVGYNSQNLPIGYFSRDWHVTAITGGTGGAGTTIDLVCDSAYTGNLPPNGATGDVATYGAIIILTGMPPDASKAKYLTASVLGEHADSMGQTDKEKRLGFLGTDIVTGTGSYQAGGITSNANNSDATEEYSRNNLAWVIGLIPGEDPVCNIAWAGMQANPVTKKKRYFLSYADTSARSWVDPLKAPFPNATLRATNTNVVYANGVDAGTSFQYLAYSGGIFSGGWLFGTPAGGDFALASRTGWNYTTSSPISYQGQRDPAASEMLSLNFQNDTGDILSTASAFTHIGRFDLTCSANFPGALANGNRCIVDANPTYNYIGLGSAVSGRRAVRGRQAVPAGINPFYVDCPVVGTAITARFGPYSIKGVPAAATTTLVVNAQTAVASITAGGSPYTFSAHPIGTAAADRDVIVAVELAWSTSRTINAVSIGGVAATAVTFSHVTSNNVRLQFWKARVPTGTTGDIVVTTSGAVNGVQVYVWACTGLGVIYDTNTAIGSAANVGASLTVATPPSGAVLGVHMYASSASGGNRLSSAMTYTGYSPANAQTISGTVTSGTNIDWNVGTEVTSGDRQVTSGGTGASLLSVITLSPAWAFDKDFTGASLTGATITQAGTCYALTAGNVLTSYSANTGRFDYNNAILRGLYVEPSRTNQLSWSTDFSNAAWAKNNTTVSAATLLGIAASDISNTVSLNSYIGNAGYLLNNSTTYTRSCYAKAVTGTGVLAFEVHDNGSQVGVTFNLLTGVAAGAGASMVDMGGGVYRCIYTWTTGATGTQRGDNNYIGAYGGTSTPTTIRMTAPQVEIGSSPSSYIPTTTVAVTRAADVLNLTGLTQANGTYTARCWHGNADYTDVTGVTVTSGAATLTGVSTKPIQGISLF